MVRNDIISGFDNNFEIKTFQNGRARFQISKNQIIIHQLNSEFNGVLIEKLMMLNRNWTFLPGRICPIQKLQITDGNQMVSKNKSIFGWRRGFENLKFEAEP